MPENKNKDPMIDVGETEGVDVNWNLNKRR